MKLTKVEIENYRSIEELTIDFNIPCRVLVGINESGKSNILKALSLLGTAKSAPEDRRQERPDEEDPISRSRVEFIFRLEKEEVEKIYENIKEPFLTKSFKTPIILESGKAISLEEFCRKRNSGVYQVDVLTQKKAATYFALPEGKYTAAAAWKKISDTCPSSTIVTIQDKSIPLKTYAFVNTQDFPEIPTECLEDLDPEEINDLVGGEIKKIVADNLPQVIFWSYDEKNLLPSTIPLDGFSANPDSCVPLKNMFNLAGYEDNQIKPELDKAKALTVPRLLSFLDRIARQTTQHFKKVWREYRNIQIDLRPDGANIKANIKEESYFGMSQRSDGFKRFMSFLLLISTKVKTDTLTDALLLIDEPEISLHPPGVRYLRDELLRIASKNYVVYSTHSPFMIDRNRIDRHILVKKVKEETSIEYANESNIWDEEVIFNAMGHSVYEVMKPKNIIFEGWTDKQLFRVALTSPKAGYKEKIALFKEVGTCHAEGVSDVKRISGLLELAMRKCVIVSDSDAVAKEKQRNFINAKGYGTWLRYDELLSRNTVLTAEDFVKTTHIQKSLEKIKVLYSVLNDSPDFSNGNRVAAIEKWLSKQSISGELKKEIIRSLKDNLYETLRHDDIEELYFDIVSSLSEYIKDDKNELEEQRVN